MIDKILREVSSGDEPAARRLKKIAKADPRVLDASRGEILHAAFAADDLRVRWNLIVVVGTLRLTRRQRAAAVDWMFERLEDKSPLTRTFAMQALWDMSAADAGLRARVASVVKRFAEEGTAAMRARAKKLLLLRAAG